MSSEVWEQGLVAGLHPDVMWRMSAGQCQGWGCRAPTGTPAACVNTGLYPSCPSEQGLGLKGPRWPLPTYFPSSWGAGAFPHLQACVAVALRPGQGWNEQDEPKMGQAEWETVLQNVPERALHPLSRMLIMVTLAWTPVNYWNLWSRMKLPSTSLPMQTRRTTNCLGEWSWGVWEWSMRRRLVRKGDLNPFLPTGSSQCKWKVKSKIGILSWSILWTLWTNILSTPGIWSNSYCFWPELASNGM